MITRVARSTPEQVQGVATPPVESSDTTTESESSDFAAVLKGMLTPDSANKVSEEDLFAALARQRIQALKGDAGMQKYDEIFAQQKAALQKPDGFVPMEEAALNTLKLMTAQGDLTAAEGDTVFSEAFSGAQLDSNTAVLYDGRGGPGDPTVAAAAIDTAIASAKAVIDKLSSGATALATKPLASAEPNRKPAGVGGAPATSVVYTSDPTLTSASSSPNGTVMDGADGFLFKPVSNSHGTLAVLLPAELTGSVASVILKDSAQNVIEEGFFTSVNPAEGNRSKWAFRRPGGEYGKDLTVEVRLDNGAVRTYSIPDGSQRYD